MLMSAIPAKKTRSALGGGRCWNWLARKRATPMMRLRSPQRTLTAGEDNPPPGDFHPVNEDLFTGTPGFHPVNEDLFTGTPGLAKGVGNGCPVMPLTKCGTAFARNAPARGGAGGG